LMTSSCGMSGQTLARCSQSGLITMTISLQKMPGRRSGYLATTPSISLPWWTIPAADRTASSQTVQNLVFAH